MVSLVLYIINHHALTTPDGVYGQLYAAIALSLGKVLTVPQWIGMSLEWSKSWCELCGEY
jgi:hypothetical protein